MWMERGAGGSLPRLSLLYLGLLVIPAATLIMLGLRLLEQDRAISAQRAVERREAAADRAARALELLLADLDRQLLSGSAPEGSVRLAVTGSSMEARPAHLAPWLPEPLRLEEADTSAFQEAEALEFRGAGEKALPIYERLSRSASAGVRAGALLRLARVHRRAGRVDAALAAYRQLSRADTIAFERMPADLLARRALCDLLQESGGGAELSREANSLHDDLLAGRWRLDRVSWTLAAEQAGRWTGRPVEPSEENRLTSEAAEWLWQEWKRQGLAGPANRGSRAFARGNTGLTLLWHASGDRVSAVVILPGLLHRWAKNAAAAVNDVGGRLVLGTDAGLFLFGQPPGTGPGIVKRNPADTGLPWVLWVSPQPGGRNAVESGIRPELLMLGLASIVLFLTAGIFLLWWTVRRELAVARLQADFVSAVSHEFRTPLTAMRHVTELLDEDDQIPRERRKAFYAALGRNTGRLQRLVESLLDFSRMERGKRPYDLQKVDAREFTNRVVDEFRREVEPRGFTIEVESASDSLPIMADDDALGHALWNLLDNAVKYSGDSRIVRVIVKRRLESIVISVRDEGFGIPAQERKEIFRKFVRGEQARRLGIQGTGIGLAMASHIVAAHRGKIELESAEGRGSVFSIVLPQGA